MNVGSLRLQKNTVMKSLLAIKVIVIFPVLVLLDYFFMILLGCTTCIFGLGNDFYCGPYCLIGKIILGLSAVLFFFLILPDIRAIFKTYKNAPSTEK
jgi:hypothetical protein